MKVQLTEGLYIGTIALTLSNNNKQYLSFETTIISMSSTEPHWTNKKSSMARSLPAENLLPPNVG